MEIERCCKKGNTNTQQRQQEERPVGRDSYVLPAAAAAASLAAFLASSCFLASACQEGSYRNCGFVPNSAIVRPRNSRESNCRQRRFSKGGALYRAYYWYIIGHIIGIFHNLSSTPSWPVCRKKKKSSQVEVCITPQRLMKKSIPSHRGVPGGTCVGESVEWAPPPQHRLPWS